MTDELVALIQAAAAASVRREKAGDELADAQDVTAARQADYDAAASIESQAMAAVVTAIQGGVA